MGRDVLVFTGGAGRILVLLFPGRGLIVALFDGRATLLPLFMVLDTPGRATDPDEGRMEPLPGLIPPGRLGRMLPPYDGVAPG